MTRISRSRAWCGIRLCGVPRRGPLLPVDRVRLWFAYRPWPDRGHRPSISVIVPAFNEASRDHCDHRVVPRDGLSAHRLEVVVVNDGSNDRTWSSIVAAKPPIPRSWRSTSVAIMANARQWPKVSGDRRAKSCCSCDSDSYLDRERGDTRSPPRSTTNESVPSSVTPMLRTTWTWLTKMQQVRYRGIPDHQGRGIGFVRHRHVRIGLLFGLPAIGGDAHPRTVGTSDVPRPTRNIWR